MSVRTSSSVRPLPTDSRLRSVLGAGPSTQPRALCCAPSAQIGAPWGATECNLCFTPLLTDDRWDGTTPVSTGPVCAGQHVFHKFCLRQWVQTNRNDCPDCRRELYPSVIEQLGGLPQPEEVDNWSAEDQALLEQLQNAMQEQVAKDARQAAAQEQAQRELRIWWDWVQAVRDGVVPAPSGWADPGTVNPFLGADVGVVLTRGMERQQAIAGEREKVARYMPTLEALKLAMLAVHRIYVYLDAHSNESDAWAYSWRAGDVNYVPYNHFSAINFMESNETMISMSLGLVAKLSDKIRAPGALAPDELLFVQSWVLAKQMVVTLEELNTHARYWAEMREEYGEWSPARER